MNEEANVTDKPAAVANAWKATHVYVMALVCLGLGVVIGYLVRGSQSTASPSPGMTASQPAAMAAKNQPPTLEKMKHMADKSAEPLLEKLKKNPNDFQALNDAGKVYRATHQFREAASYYQRALQLDPTNAPARTDLASCLYYTGDVDGALTELNKALSYDPKFFGALLNVGIIKLQAKNDPAGAIKSWQKILKTDPDAQHKAVAQKLIAEAKQMSAQQISNTKPESGTEAQ